MDGCSSTDSRNYCLKWNDYQAHVLSVLVQLLQAETMVDVTLCASGGEKICAHRIVLCACSNYFQEILSQTDDSHPVVILSEVSAQDIRCILEFVYQGELNVDASRFSSILEVAEALQIRGLMEVHDHLPNLETAGDGGQGDLYIETLSESSQAVKDHVVDEGSEQIAVAVQVEESAVSSIQSVNSTLMSNETLTEHMPQQEIIRQEIIGQEIIGQEEEHTQPSQEHSYEYEQEYCGRLKITMISDEKPEKKKRRRRENCRKEYSEEQLNAALADLSSGQLLMETAATHNIPRSTLYVRAKAAGIPITVSRQEHSMERVNAAVQAVTGGASLQQASMLFQIPKTVLWRRVRAAGGREGWGSRRKQAYGQAHRQAAVQALQSGQNLSKVSAQYQIPKTTLFREKARLVQAGKLPSDSLKRRDPEICAYQQARISEAVAACKEGKMSQAVASITYKVPKTTIWRRLQKGVESRHDGDHNNVHCVEISHTSTSEEPVDGTEAKLQEHLPFGFCESNGQLPVTYIVSESDFSETPLII